MQTAEPFRFRARLFIYYGYTFWRTAKHNAYNDN